MSGTGASDRIELRGLRVRGFHGVYEHERRDGQDFVIDLVLQLPLRTAAMSDDVADTVHYGELAVRIADLVAGEPVDLLETLAERIASSVLADERVERVEVRVHKPSAPIPLDFEDVAVSIERSADHVAVLSLGSNLGDRADLLRSAVRELSSTPGISVVAESSVVESVAQTLQGADPGKPAYLNQVVRVRTSLPPSALLERTQGIEARHGRVREERWGDRTLDIDIVTYDTLETVEPGLELPHPRAAERAFVLRPWLELDPDAVLPGRGRVAELAARLDDTPEVSP